MLKDLLVGVSSWDELKSRISKLDTTEKERGDVFEEFCKAYFKLSEERNFKDVFAPIKEAPRSILEKLNLHRRDVLGVDGICTDYEGKTYAYQAKFRTDVKILTKDDISMFLGYSEKADYKILITTTTDIPRESEDRLNIIIKNGHLDDLSKDFFRRLRIYCKENKIAETKKTVPHITAKESIINAVKYYKKNDRGQLILPCGTGKTLIAMWIFEKLKAKTVLIMVPSLALMAQTLTEWANQNSNWRKKYRYQCICSDDTVDESGKKRIDTIDERESDIFVPVTTQQEEIVKFLKYKTDRISLLLCTYQSSDILSQALKKTKTKIDFAIVDEAHRTASQDEGHFGYVKFDRNIPVKKRLFMTATPRVFSKHVSRRLENENIPIHDMSNTHIYGKEIYHMNFAEAIKRNHITDYRILIVECSNSLYNKLVKENKYVRPLKGKKKDSIFAASALAKRITLIKAMNERAIKKSFTFHNSVANAKTFTSAKETQGLKNIYKLYDIESKTPELFHVNGKMKMSDRKEEMKDFRNAKTAIMSNARCLSEGVNIPAVDSIIFITPKKSQVDIIQATGRALRKDPENKNKIAYIIIPIFVDDNQDVDEIAQISEFKTVYDVIRAMKDQDTRLELKINSIRISQGSGSPERDGGVELPIDYWTIAKGIDKTKFYNSFRTKIVEIVSENWDFWYGLTLKFMKSNKGDPNCIYGHYESGYPLNNWQGTQRQEYKNGKLSEERIKKLESIGFIWNKFTEQWSDGYQETLKYMKETGNAKCLDSYKTKDGYPLGNWQRIQINNYKNGKLSKKRIKKLENIGFNFSRDYNKEVWDAAFQETLKYMKETGNANCPVRHKTKDGYTLGGWQFDQKEHYKNGELSEERIKKLESIGFAWISPHDIVWTEAFQKTLKYMKETGNANCPERHITKDGYALGYWQQRQRKAHNKGKLSKKRIKRLDDIGFIFVKDDVRKVVWNKRFQKTLKYMKETGNANCSNDYKTKDGYPLGRWQQDQKDNYKNGTLSEERIKKLESIGFIWYVKIEKMKQRWTEGYQETLKYMKETGNANYPTTNYQNIQGFDLKIWQQLQKENYKNGTLSKEKIEKLENIGFIFGNLNDYKWDKAFQKTLKYMKETGNTTCSRDYKTKDGYPLGNWQRTQRNRYRKKKLSKDRIDKLNKIGFSWELTK